MDKQIKNRIKSMKTVRAGDLVPHPKNWRTHPTAQAEALRGLLAEVGFAGAILTRTLPDGKLQIIDGHLRAETLPDMKVPVLVTDLTEAEADKLLATLDPMAAMAEAAEQLNRRCFGLEISTAYCDVIVKRWENLTGKKAKREKNHG